MSEEGKSTESIIEIKVQLDEMKVPEKMEWSSTDSQTKNAKECKGLILSVWDEEQDSAMRIDLWTKEMRIDEMDRFFFQTFVTLSDTYQRATGNEKGTKDIKDFAMAFGKKAGVIN